MTFKNKSIFNLIEIFTSRPIKVTNTISTETHCEQKHIHDYYCDAEKPFIGYN
ncbi:hypothetical protein [Winogradskyella vidalii]|uniref:hypothetical protein n=1 Tax=Winogradskyella vidalii TaxID=2615024 RepID=UPI0015CCE538|nr:hypothetical protein [Winogradskyella vidalii]